MYEKIYIPSPKFWWPIVGYITELEKLRNPKNILFSQFREIPLPLFFQLKELFQLIESVSSARIEGNRTTIAEYMVSENKDKENKNKQNILEIKNIHKGINFIEELKQNWNWIIVNRVFFEELHKILMKDLLITHEGDQTPWAYRKYNVSISQSNHTPPDFLQVYAYMEELIDFIENYEKDKPQYDLLKIAIAHHRFVWIHPFWNWNGRMVRLLTYALLIKYWFDIAELWLLNPSTLFCVNREQYYDFLGKADIWSKEGLLNWCEYAIQWIFNETKMLETLLRKDFVLNNILKWATNSLILSWIIDENDQKILMTSYRLWSFALKDVKDTIDLHSTTVSWKIKKLIELWLLTQKDGKKAIYIPLLNINLDLFYSIFRKLADNGFNSWLSLDKN